MQIVTADGDFVDYRRENDYDLKNAEKRKSMFMSPILLRPLLLLLLLPVEQTWAYEPSPRPDIHLARHLPPLLYDDAPGLLLSWRLSSL